MRALTLKGLVRALVLKVIHQQKFVITDINNVELTYGGGDPKFLNPEFIARSAHIELPYDAGKEG